MSRGAARPRPRRPRGPARTVTRIRRARLEDAAAVAAVMRAAIRTLARGFYGSRQLSRWSSLPALYHAWAMTAGGEEYVVAEREGRVVGYAARRGRELTALFVLPSVARGGVGRALLRRVEAEAVRAGARTLRVRAALSALAFYEAMGFRAGRRISVPLPGGGALAARGLVKRLAPRA